MDMAPDCRRLSWRDLGSRAGRCKGLKWEGKMLVERWCEVDHGGLMGREHLTCALSAVSPKLFPLGKNQNQSTFFKNNLDKNWAVHVSVVSPK